MLANCWQSVSQLVADLRTLTYAPLAILDLLEIGSYLETQANNETAARIVKQIEDYCDLLCRHPYRNPAAHYAGEEMRVGIVINYRIFYLAGSGINVVRVLHQSRSLTAEMLMGQHS